MPDTEHPQPPTSPQALLARLSALGIAASSFSHPPVFTVEQAKALRGELAGGHIKNLFLRNKKGAMWLVTCLEDRDIDLKALGRALGAQGSGRARCGAAGLRSDQRPSAGQRHDHGARPRGSGAFPGGRRPSAADPRSRRHLKYPSAAVRIGAGLAPVPTLRGPIKSAMY
jgi:hypothetical protein